MSDDKGLIQPLEPPPPGYGTTIGPRGRRIVQITTGILGSTTDAGEAYQHHVLYALCSDGTLWGMQVNFGGNAGWQQVEDVPAPTGVVRDGVRYPK